MSIKSNKKAGLLSQAVLLSLVTGAFILVASLSTNDKVKNQLAGDNFVYPEVEEIQEKQISSFKDLTKYFTDLANKKGGEYAFKVLAIAPIAPNTDMHLLGHGVGDVLYKQRGVDGMKVCTQDFRNACSHSIVVGLLLEKGEGVMPIITEACKDAPGGPGAYTMCFHGLGHGVLAYTGYELPRAVDLCKKAGTEGYNNRESIECIGGTIMEIIGGGFHNQELWKIQSAKYLPENDPLYPCNSDFIPDNARRQCYMYLTPHLFAAAGGQKALGSPTPTDFEKAFQFCDKLPKDDASNRNACYGGFGKEFVVLAKDRDIRNIDKMTNEEMLLAYSWCELAKDEYGISSCISNMLASIFWGGENDPAASVRFCGLINNSQMQEQCFGELINSESYYVKDENRRRNFCDSLPEKRQNDCKQTLSVR